MMNSSCVQQIKFLVFGIIIISSISFAEDRNYFIPSATTLPSTIEEMNDDEGSSYFIPKSVAEEMDKGDSSESSFIPKSLKQQDVEDTKGPKDFSHIGKSPDVLKDKNILERDRLKQSGQAFINTSGTSKEYSEYSIDDNLDKVSNAGDKTFSFVFYKDDYNYYNSNNSFDSTYRYTGLAGQRGSDPAGILRITGHQLWTTTPVKIGWGIGAGVGYNGGFGFFNRSVTGNEQSNARFHLWTFPLDLSMALEAPLFSWMKFGVYGGPSAMGLLQVRNDFEDKHARKRVRQVGYGYFAAAKLHFSLTGLSSASRNELFTAYSITKYYLTLEARMQSYDNFASPDVSIDGTSFGVGFNFEYF